MYRRQKKIGEADGRSLNESGYISSSLLSLFDDRPSKQRSTRAAVYNISTTEKDNPASLAGTSDAERSSSEYSFNFTSAAPHRGLRKHMNNFINNSTTSLKLEESNEVLPTTSWSSSALSKNNASSLPSNVYRQNLDNNRLQAELMKLQRQMESLRRDRFRALDVNETVRRIMGGDPVSLEFYRAKSEKIQLLDAAIDVLDSNAIQTVILFLKQTLHEDVFREILLNKPEAAEEYIAYLKARKLHEELVLTLFALGRTSEASMVEVSVAIRHKTPELRIDALKKCTMSEVSDPQLSTEATIVNDYINLLERQVLIEQYDCQSSSDVFKRFPKNRSLVGRSAVTTMYYSCLYHYDLPQNSLANPYNLRNNFHLSEKEFVWAAVNALVEQSRWPDVEKLLLPKTVNRIRTNKGTAAAKKLICPFSWENLFTILYSNRVPPPKALSVRLLRNVPDQELRLKFAEKYDITEIVVEALVAQRDRLALSKYYARLARQSPEAYKALAALTNSRIKWKN